MDEILIRQREKTLRQLKTKGQPVHESEEFMDNALQYMDAHMQQASSKVELAFLAAEYSQNQAGRTCIPSVGGTKFRPWNFNLLSVDESVENLHFVAVRAKDWAFAQVSTSDGRNLAQGTPEYLNHIATVDPDFIQLLRENPDLFDGIASGRIRLHNDMCWVDDTGLDSIQYRSQPFVFTPETLAVLRERIHS